jgi:hypothetical protein
MTNSLPARPHLALRRISFSSRMLALLMAPVLVAANAQDRGCFEELHDKNTSPAERSFDYRFDRPLGGRSFSCDLYTTASQARRVLDVFRSGVLYEDEAALQRSIRFPLTVNIQDTLSIQEKARTIKVLNPKDWLVFQRENFRPEHKALVACSSVLNVDVVTSRSYGFMIGGGMIWFQKPVGDAGPRVTVVNFMPEPDHALLRDCKGIGSR